MVTIPKIDVLHFAFLKLSRAKAKMDIFKCPKNVQKWGVKILRNSGLSAILNEIFLTGLYLKYGLANANNYRIYKSLILNQIFSAEK
jgi:hypothetical protein